MTLKLKTRTQFPANVTVASPILLTKTGLTYSFSFDANAFDASLGGIYPKNLNNLSDLAFRYTAFDNLSIHGADIASAATVNLETATGNLVDVTGTTTITAITLSEGHERTVRFTGALTLTNGASLVLPSGANITTVAGDYAIFRGYAAGVVRCISYSPFTVTGTGSAVLATSPTLTGAVINKVTITAPATSATLTLIDGTTLTGPAASGTAMTLGNVETVTGAKTFGAAGNVGKLIVAGTTSGSTILNATAVASGTLSLPAATDTLVGKATTDILTNKTLDSAGTGNVLKVSGVTVSAGQYPGETTTGSATAGNVGEYIESVVAQASAVSLTTATAKDITTLVLTAGDWDIDANVGFVTASTTSITQMFCGISTTLNTMDFTAGRAAGQVINATVPTAGANYFLPVQPIRVSISGSTTYHLVATGTFTASTLTAFGIIRARRVR